MRSIERSHMPKVVMSARELVIERDAMRAARRRKIKKSSAAVLNSLEEEREAERKVMRAARRAKLEISAPESSIGSDQLQMPRLKHMGRA